MFLNLAFGQVHVGKKLRQGLKKCSPAFKRNFWRCFNGRLQSFVTPATKVAVCETWVLLFRQRRC
jgi:hypothetical protein